MNVEEEIVKLKTDVAKLGVSKKDGWDKLQIAGTFLIPVVIAIFAWRRVTWLLIFLYT